MKFRYLNQPPNEFDYHVARADVRENAELSRVVAYGATVADAEAVLLDGLGTGDILDLGSV